MSNLLSAFPVVSSISRDVEVGSTIYNLGKLDGKDCFLAVSAEGGLTLYPMSMDLDQSGLTFSSLDLVFEFLNLAGE